MNREEYNRLMDQVSPSPELVKRTRERIRQEGEKRRKTAQRQHFQFSLFRRTLAAAAEMLVISVNISPAFVEIVEMVALLGLVVQAVTVRNWFSQEGDSQTTPLACAAGTWYPEKRK